MTLRSGFGGRAIRSRGGVPASMLARSLSCALVAVAACADAAAAPAAMLPTDGLVAAIAVQPDGKAIVGGTFAAIGGRPCHDICRLNANGSVDDSFADVNADGELFSSVYALGVLPGHKVLVGGTLAPTMVGEQIVDHLLRLNGDGSVDETFSDSSPDGAVLSMAPQPDGRIWVGGSFISIGGQLRANLARLGADGSVDATAALSDTDDEVRALALRPDGKLWVAGYFNAVGTQTRHSLALLDADGGVDAAFADSNVSGGINALALRPNRLLWLGGDFAAGSGPPRYSLTRMDAYGRLDQRFADAQIERIFALPPVLALAVQPNGKLWVGGSFVAIGGQPRHYLARLNADGSLDADFADPGLDGWVFALAVQPDGAVWVGGDFLLVGGHARAHLAQFKADGTLDSCLAASGDE
jgi:uncharacterized delta-60 repeat protein